MKFAILWKTNLKFEVWSCKVLKLEHSSSQTALASGNCITYSRSAAVVNVKCSPSVITIFQQALSWYYIGFKKNNRKCVFWYAYFDIQILKFAILWKTNLKFEVWSCKVLKFEDSSSQTALGSGNCITYSRSVAKHSQCVKWHMSFGVRCQNIVTPVFWKHSVCQRRHKVFFQNVLEDLYFHYVTALAWLWLCLADILGISS